MRYPVLLALLAAALILGGGTAARAATSIYYSASDNVFGWCAGFAATPAYTAAVTGGNSLSCRIYHATAASTGPATHCPHTAMDGGGVCI